MSTLNDVTSPCQGNDRCTMRVFDDAPKCSRCKLSCCTKHSLKINGALLCEICIKQRFETSDAAISGRSDRGRLDPVPSAYVSALALSERYSDEERLDFAADFRPGDEQ